MLRRSSGGFSSFGLQFSSAGPVPPLSLPQAGAGQVWDPSGPAVGLRGVVNSGPEVPAGGPVLRPGPLRSTRPGLFFAPAAPPAVRGSFRPAGPPGFLCFWGAGSGAAFGKTARLDAGEFSAPWGRWGRAFLPAGAFGRPFNSFSLMFRLSLPLKNGLFVLCLIVLVVVTVVGAGDVVENSLSRRCGADFPGLTSWGSSCGRLVERAGPVIFSTQDVQNGS